MALAAAAAAAAVDTDSYRNYSQLLQKSGKTKTSSTYNIQTTASNATFVQIAARKQPELLCEGSGLTGSTRSVSERP